MIRVKKIGLFPHRKSFSPPLFECLATLAAEAGTVWGGGYWIYELFCHVLSHLYITNSSQQATSCSAIITSACYFSSPASLFFWPSHFSCAIHLPLSENHQKWATRKQMKARACWNIPQHPATLILLLHLKHAQECDPVSNSLSPLWLQ